MINAAAMVYLAFVVKEKVIATTTLNVQVLWFVVKTIARGVTKMTVV